MTHSCHCSAPRPHAGLASRSGGRSMCSTAAHLQDRVIPRCTGSLGHQKLQVTPGKASPRSCRKVCRTSASYNNNSGGVDIADRVVAALPFCIPLFDGLRYGKFFMLQFPIMAKILAPLDPVIRLYFGFPFASLIIFFAAYLGIVNNQNFSRYVRFAVLQAVLLDVVLILPSLIENLIRPPSSGPGLQLYISAYNTVWLFVFLCVSYGAVTCLLGKTPRLPFIADAAEQQLR